MLIFGIAFGIMWFCRRRKAIPKNKKKDEETIRKAEDVDSDDDSDDDEEEEGEKPRRDQKSPSATSGPAARARAAQQSSIDQRRYESEKAPPRPPRSEQTLGHDLNPRSQPSSRASSRAGSPVGHSHTRQLSLTNPDYRNSTRSSRVAPALNRPPSSVSKPQQVQRPQTAYQSQTRQPAVSSGLKPQDPRTVRASSYVPQAGDRRPSQAQNPRAHSVHPPSGNPARSSSRSSSVSMYSNTSRKPSYQDIPLPALPSEAHRARVDSVYSIASRKNEDPPGYTSSSSRDTSPKMKAQAPPRLVDSRPGVSRQSTMASVESYADASEYLQEAKKEMPARRAQRKPQAIAESPLPYDK